MKDLSRPNGFASLDDTVGAAPPSVVIVPYVLRSCASGASGLPAMSLIEQMSFFAENVRSIYSSRNDNGGCPGPTGVQKDEWVARVNWQSLNYQFVLYIGDDGSDIERSNSCHSHENFPRPPRASSSIP